MPNMLRFGNWIAASWDRSEPGLHLVLGITEWIYKGASPFQEIVIARVEGLGLALFLDATVQAVEADEFVYHEHLVLPALLYHPAPRRVLILGGGDGLALREALRDPRVEQVVMVELDGQVVEACREHLADLHRGSFDDPRAHIVIGDARHYLKDAPERFDVVLVDLVDPYGAEGMSLYMEVIQGVRRVMAPGAIVTTHGEGVDPPLYLALRVYALLAERFRYVELHRQAITTFAGDWGFILASDEVDFRRVPTTTLKERAGELAGPLKSLILDRFPVAFQWPLYLRKALHRIQETRAYIPEGEAAGAVWLYPNSESGE